MATREVNDKIRYDNTHKMIDNVLYKKCNKHAEYFPNEDEWVICDIGHFYKIGYIKKDGEKSYSPYCKQCTIKKSYKWSKDNPESHEESQNKAHKTINYIEKTKKINAKRRENGQYKIWQQNNTDKIKNIAIDTQIKSILFQLKSGKDAKIILKTNITIGVVHIVA